MVRPLPFVAAVLVAVACAAVHATSALAVPLTTVSLPGTPASEAEPNGSPANASPISSGQRVRAPLFPSGDVDYYKFTASEGDRVYAAVMTAGSAGSSTDSQLTLLGSDGTTAIEFDDDNGSFANLSSSIAGATIPEAGTYYLKVNDYTASTTTERPYDLYFRVASGTPTPEVEPNDTPATANPLPANGWVSGARNPAAANEQDWYSLQLNAGDTVFLSLDLDPERDGVTWNGRLGLGLFGDGGNQIPVIDDTGTGDVSPNPNRPSEALMLTVKQAGTYFAFVASASAAVGGPTATYDLAVTVLPAAQQSCREYTVTGSDAIGPGTSTLAIDIPVDDDVTIDRAAVALSFTHALMQDVDASLQPPDGPEIGLFTDIGAATTGGQHQMDTLFDEFAAITPSFTTLKGLSFQPEAAYRLSWLNGMRTQGTWHLILRDDTAGADGGTFDSVTLTLCARSVPTDVDDVYHADFEAGADGFTDTGVNDEWERGTPATPATSTLDPPPVAGLDRCAQGDNCWKTDLDGTYEPSSDQDLLSPPITLEDRSGRIFASWQQWYQMESANVDHASVSIEDADGSDARTLWDWLDGTMVNNPGNPVFGAPAAAGWGYHEADVSDYAGHTVRLRFHLDSNASINLAGLAIDDVRIFQERRTATVTLAGSGDGYVDSSPAGIDCGTDATAHPACEEGFADGTSVTLTAHPASGSRFDGFSGGGCSGSAVTCTVTVDDAAAVTATFVARHDLTVGLAGDGAGSVTSDTGGIDCGATCSATYDEGSTVTLTAHPASGSRFAGFSDAGCATTCTVTIADARAVTATFTAIPVETSPPPASPLPPRIEPPPPPPPTDVVAPRTSASRVASASRQPITLRGSASDAGTVRRIRVSVARHVGKACEFLREDGTFSKPRDCRKTSYVDARGTTSWSLKLPKLKPGRYTVWTRGIDAAGNVERKNRARNLLVVRSPRHPARRA